ncbi:mechanosensitive ion channel family protein [Elizabethkingia sp. JS20170427COW]|uniref:mechanosensitive ion channel family protein n=1 Tax=Elizabethkingia sp. JS20170427COW TaxID=2583851 RepID=UPI0011104ADF|nr:mechanosensitive ion channel family protein [Elizabethkingia sp. JS20170427COW]QCX52584.1 mechanosensitive ion channel family protein [Elizabethkingia sp. JS20170427COW]
MEKLITVLEAFLDSILMALPKYVIGILVLFIGNYVIKFLISVLAKRFAKRDLDKSLSGFLLSFIKLGLYIALVGIAVGIMGFKSMSLTAVFGAAGLAIGMALQGSLSNFAGGILILFFKPFKVGDYISNNSGTTGTVERIDLLYTTLVNDDGLKVFSPNGPLANSVITNFTVVMQRRYTCIVGVSYDANIKEVQNLLLKVIAEFDAVKATPKPNVFVHNLGESSVDLKLVFWIERTEYWDVVFKVQQRVKEALDQANIEIPFPHRDLRIISEERSI